MKNIILCLLIVFVLQSCSVKKDKNNIGTAIQTTANRANIIFSMSDDYAWQAISAYGQPTGKLASTANIDGSQPIFLKLLLKAGYYTTLGDKWHLLRPLEGFEFWKSLNDQDNYFNSQFITIVDTIHIAKFMSINRIKLNSLQ